MLLSRQIPDETGERVGKPGSERDADTCLSLCRNRAIDADARWRGYWV